MGQKRAGRDLIQCDKVSWLGYFHTTNNMLSTSNSKFTVLKLHCCGTRIDSFVLEENPFSYIFQAQENLKLSYQHKRVEFQVFE